jgi:hypothetical protein
MRKSKNQYLWDSCHVSIYFFCFMGQLSMDLTLDHKDYSLTLERATSTSATNVGVALRMSGCVKSSIACFNNTGPANPFA